MTLGAWKGAERKGLIGSVQFEYLEVGFVVGDQGDAEGAGVSGDQLVQRVLVAGPIAQAQRTVSIRCAGIERLDWGVFDQAVQQGLVVGSGKSSAPPAQKVF